MQYRMEKIDDNTYIIKAVGPIVDGDADRLRNYILSNITVGKIIGFTFDSPGGSLLEGEALAIIIHTTGAVVLIPENSTCASACFLVLAAAKVKMAGADALIGVHSASLGDSETLATMGMTTAMARDAAAYGVPPAIIGKMVQTQPGRVEWLTPDDLASMGIQILKPSTQTQTPTTSPPSAGPAPGLGVATTGASVALAPPSPGFSQGQVDRPSWAAWFGSLAGDDRTGAEYWASQRSLPHPGSCQPTPAMSVEWSSGCMSAQQRLTQVDIRRKREPDYRAGWNAP